MSRSENLRQGTVTALCALAITLLAGAVTAGAAVETAADAAAVQELLFAPAFFAGGKVETATLGSCNASATCYNGSTVSCSSSVGPCDFDDASCPEQRGYVVCAGQQTWCPQCPASSYCVQGASCSGPRSCGTGAHAGVCYQGACRCYCTQGASCSQDSHCGPPATSGGHCVNGSCYCD